MQAQRHLRRQRAQAPAPALVWPRRLGLPGQAAAAAAAVGVEEAVLQALVQALVQALFPAPVRVRRVH